MKWFGFFALLFCPISYSETLSLEQWLNHFSHQQINIIYSSDFVSSYDTQTKIELKTVSINEFKLQLENKNLSLLKVEDDTYVIKSKEEIGHLNTGLIIQVIDSETLQTIHQFSIKTPSQIYKSNNNRVVIDNLNKSSLKLKIEADGYFDKTLTVKIAHDKYSLYTYQLSSKPLEIDKVIVTASKIDFQSSVSSQNSLNRDDIKHSIPLGNDPLRVAESIAGNTNNGLNGKSKTRGGLENESLIVFDNYTLRNPYHFKNFNSLFSTINLSLVDSIDFYSGVFPIEYGGRLSSAMNIQSTDNISQSKHQLDLNFLNSSYTYKKSNSSYTRQFQTAVRLGGQLIDTKTLRPEFDDIYVKYTQELNNYWTSSQHFLLSRDEISVNDINDEGIGESVNTDSHDQNLWIQWFYNNQQNNRLSFQLYSSRKHDRRMGMINNIHSNGSLYDRIFTRYSGLKYQQDIILSEDLQLKFGLDLYSESTEIDNQFHLQRTGELVQQLGINNSTARDFEFKNSGHGADAFINTRYRINKSLIFDLGVRFEHKQWIDQTVNSPRFNISYFVNKNSIVRFALGRHQQSQYIDELLLEDENPEYFSPTSADIAVLEWSKYINENINLRSEIYIKKYSSTHPYYENLFNSYHFLPELHYDRVRITPEDSSARGLELTINGKHEKLNWSAIYSFSDVDDLIDDKETPRSWDQHNALKLQLSHPLNNQFMKNWLFNLKANYHSGWAKTSLNLETNGLILGDRNKDTFNDFYQFDLSFTKNKKTNKGLMNYSIQINNILNTKNTCCISYQFENEELNFEEKNWLPISPNFSFSYQWD